MNRLNLHRPIALAVALSFLLLPAATVGAGHGATDMPLHISVAESLTLAGRSQELTTRQITVQNNDNGGRVLTELLLSVPTVGGTQGQTVQGILWSGTLSQGPEGWAVSVLNQETRQLRFVANTPAAGIPPATGTGDGALFTLGLSVEGAPPEGTQFNVAVSATFDTGATTGATDGDLYKILIDDSPPSVLPQGVITLDTFTGIAVQPNGKLDQLVVYFDEPLDQRTFDMRDLRITDRSRSPAHPYDLTRFEWLPRLAGGQDIFAGGHKYGQCPPAQTLGCDGVLLTVAEGFEFDTGARPDLWSPNPSVTDLSGNRLRPIQNNTLLEIDGAHPVLVTALAKDHDGDAIDMEGIALTFSERVRPTGGQYLGTLDLDYHDINCNGCSGNQLGTPNDHNSIAGNWDVAHPPGDADPSATNLAEITLKTVSPLNRNDVVATGPDRISCAQGRIRDLSSSDNGQGLLCIDVTVENVTRDATRVSVPGIVQAEINIDSDAITVDFLVPVSDASGDNVPVRPEAFDIVPTDGGGPQGIDSVVQSSPCTTKVIIHLDRPALPTDVDATPSHLRVLDGAIKGCRSGAANPLFVPGGDTRLVDLTQPNVMTAATVDEDSNGIIDGMFLTFSEPILDQSFCPSAVDRPSPTTPTTWCTSMVGLADRTGMFTSTIGAINRFRFDTDLAANDRFGVIRWEERANPRLDTGYVPELCLWGNLFIDLATQPNQLKQTGALCDLTEEQALLESDGAPPVVLKAHTIERETRLRGEATGQGTPCTVGKERLCEPDPDGFIDAYRLIFSEKVVDSSFRSQDWHAEGRRLAVNPPVTLDTVLADDKVNDDRIVLAFCEGPVDQLSDGDTCSVRPDLPKNVTREPDTDHKPQLTYNQPPPAGLLEAPVGVRDLAGNRLDTIDVKKIHEEDGAVPVIVRIDAFVNQTSIKITFSEPVDDGAGGALVRSDFVYSNGNPDRRDPARTATGLNNTVEIEHNPGNETATIAINRPLTQEDLLVDRVGANLASIRESTQSVVDKQFAYTTLKPFNRGIDLLAPGPVEPTVQLPTANSVVLSWTAPGDDGPATGDTVCGYAFKIAQEPFTTFVRNESVTDPTKVPAHVLPVDWQGRQISTTFSPAQDPANGSMLAGPGQEQRVTLVGFDPEVEYFVAVLAYDCDRDGDGLPLMGTWGKPAVSFETMDDPDGPEEGPLNLRSTTHPVNSPRLVSTAHFLWNPLVDTESTVVYHYVLDQQPDTRVTRTHESTVSTSIRLPIPSVGTWYFHLRAFSAGGEQPTTTTYKLIYGHDVIDVNEIRAYNLELRDNVEIRREGGVNIIEWQLPPIDEGRQLQALRVWRLENGRYALLDTVVGDAVQLSTSPNNLYRDESKESNADTRYFVDAVFSTDQHGGDPSLATYLPLTVDAGKEPRAQTWVWFALGGAILLVIGGILVVAILRARHVPPSSYLDEVGTDAETGLPSHRVTCPNCSHGFAAVGHAPLEITCPECGTTGVLE